MRITGLQTFLVQPRWLFLKVTTDAGIDGWGEPVVVADGYIQLPTAPGLGVEVDEDVVRERSGPGDWDTPRLRHADDGSVADW